MQVVEEVMAPGGAMGKCCVQLPQRFRERCCRLAVLLAISLGTVVVQADTLSGTIEQQETTRSREREKQLRDEMERQADVRLPREEGPDARLPSDESPCFPIERIVFAAGADEFLWALSAADPPGDVATGRCLGSQGINRVMARIQNAIIARGFTTTRVLAEPQDLKTGTLTLKVIPGRIHAIRFSADSDSRANAWNAFPAKPGDLLNLRDIEQALENFKRVPTAEADIQIEPAELPGESDIVITWKQSRPFRITLSANDGGGKTTGKYQGTATLSGDNLLTLNDLFYVSYNHDLGGAEHGENGTDGHTYHYSLPFGYWLLSLTSSDSAYRQAVAGINQTYLYSGKSANHEIKLTRTVYRDATQKTALSLRGYLNTSHNFIDDAEVLVQERRTAGWELGINHRINLSVPNNATLELNAAYRRGTGAFDAMAAPEEAFGEGTSRPQLWTAEADFSAPFSLFGQRFQYNGTWRAQWNRTPLVPQDRFSIGGRYTVRGFDGETILSAERGYLIRNDLSLALGESGQQLYLGIDYGRVAGQTADLLLGRSLMGGVLGLRGGGKGFNYDLFAGVPIDKPKGFPTSHVTAGFNVTFTY